MTGADLVSIPVDIAVISKRSRRLFVRFTELAIYIIVVSVLSSVLIGPVSSSTVNVQVYAGLLWCCILGMICGAVVCFKWFYYPLFWLCDNVNSVVLLDYVSLIVVPVSLDVLSVLLLFYWPIARLLEISKLGLVSYLDDLFLIVTVIPVLVGIIGASTLFVSLFHIKYR